MSEKRNVLEHLRARKKMSNKILKAIKIASKVHSNQIDKLGNPYMAHVIDVSKRVSDLGEKYEITALLHDALEDAHPDILKEVESEVKEFGKEIFDAITAMTKTEKDDYFEDYLPRVKENKIATKVKIADASHNLSKNYLLPVNNQNKSRNKYTKVLIYFDQDPVKCEKRISFDGNQWIEM